MKPPRFTDRRRRYRTAAESSQPGYLAKRFKAYARLERMKGRIEGKVFQGCWDASVQLRRVK
jgi:hypothetical protein